MKHHRPNRCLAAAIAIALGAGVHSAWATNGMNLEGYGPIATAMGGAAQAYDNGTAAMMNNPATLGLMKEGNRVDLALGMLGPDVSATATTPGGASTADSSATAFFMPALGWARRSGEFTFGFGVFGQGGMGTEYGADTWMADPSQGGMPNTALTNRSEVSVGRAMIPLAYRVNEQITLGGSLDFVWAGMDLQMAMSEAQFQDLANPASQQAGYASGSLVDSFGQLYEPFGAPGPGINTLHYAYFDFSDDSAFTGKAKGYGLGGKLGAVLRFSPRFTLGLSYHSKTRISDLTADGATLTMAVNGDQGTLTTGTPSGSDVDMAIPVTGKITVRDFQWPTTIAVGAALQVNDRLMLVGDVKNIGWSGVMKEFSMTFEADNTASNGGFAGKKMDMALYQNWRDQTVLALGGAYRVNDSLTLRLGVNRAADPIPATYLNALFPAIVENHISAGVGYAQGPLSVDFSLTRASEAQSTNPGNGSTVPPVTSTHSQLNWQLMGSYRF